MKKVPVISIIVPIHNVKKYLSSCLESLVMQTFTDIEIICVDDYSTDGGSDIIAKYAAQDSRIEAIYLEKNMGTSFARKVGVKAAKGKYIMFCDADDRLALNACEIVFHEMTECSVDILHFGTTPIYCGNYSLQEKQELEKVLKPYLKLFSGDLCKACFKEQRWNYTLWNKAYNADICKKAFSRICDKFIIVSEDLYAFFLISLYSTTYKGVKDKLYYYNFGIGITPSKSAYFDELQFKNQCTRLTALEELNNFAKENNLENSYKNILASIRNTTVRELIWQWRFKLSVSYAKNGYNYLIERLGASCVISEFAKQFWNDSEGILDRLASPRRKVIGGKKAKNIGVYYHRLRNGGVEKVLSELLFIWKRLGYNIILFTDEAETDDDYPIPDNVQRIVLPNFRNSHCEKYKKRARAWEHVIKEFNIDTILYHSCTCFLLLWDSLLIKGLDCNLVIETHSMFCGSMWYDPLFSSLLPQIYYLADRVVALSNIDLTFWNNYCPAYYIPNPIKTIAIEDMSKLDSLNVLWVGRLAEEKKPYAMLDAFSIVYTCIPQANLTMVGDGDGPEWLTGLREYARKLGIENAVQFTGYELDTEPYYRNASVFVMTSISESFSMVLAESIGHGLPVVMFELPNLELTQGNTGIISVHQGDIGALANEIIILLQNENLRKELGIKARSHLNKFLECDISQLWKRLLEGLEYPVNCTVNPTYELVFNMLLKSVHQGVKCIQERYIYERSNNVNPKYEEILNRHEEVVNRHEEVVNRHEEVVNRHEEVINRHEKSINHQWEVQKWHEERIQALEGGKHCSVKQILCKLIRRS